MTLVLAAGVVVASCGAAEDREAEELEQALEAALVDVTDADVEVDPDTGAVTVEDAEGRFTSGDDLPRPAWLPSEIPVPDGFLFETYIESGSIRSARGRTDLDTSSLLDFYRHAIESLGWPIDGEELEGAAFFQIRTTTPDGTQLDIEAVNGGLAFVTGRIRPTP